MPFIDDIAINVLICVIIWHWCLPVDLDVVTVNVVAAINVVAAFDVVAAINVVAAFDVVVAINDEAAFDVVADYNFVDIVAVEVGLADVVAASVDVVIDAKVNWISFCPIFASSNLTSNERKIATTFNWRQLI